MIASAGLTSLLPHQPSNNKTVSEISREMLFSLLQLAGGPRGTVSSRNLRHVQVLLGEGKGLPDKPTLRKALLYFVLGG
jgi:hypothetical protein